MHATQNALRAQTCMCQYWKKHFLTGKIQNSEKEHVRQADLPGHWPTNPGGGWVGYILVYNQLTKCGCWKLIVKAPSH